MGFFAKSGFSTTLRNIDYPRQLPYKSARILVITRDGEGVSSIYIPEMIKQHSASFAWFAAQGT